jgi:streptogramin lyase
VVTNYTGTRIKRLQRIVAGPDGAMWFTSYGTNSIARITTTEFHRV